MSTQISKEFIATIANDTLLRLKTLKVGLLEGGISKEREGSFQTGTFFKNELIKLGVDFVVIDPSIPLSSDLFSNVDIVLNGLHGQYGEDGKIQSFLELIGKPYNGSGVLASAVGMDKVAFKRFISSLSVQTPGFVSLPSNLEDILPLGFPLMLKPNSEGGSIGMQYVDNEDSLKKVLYDVNQSKESFFLEEFIEGKIITLPLIEIGEHVVNLPSVEIILDASGKKYYDKEAKYNKGFSTYAIPANVSPTAMEIATKSAFKVWSKLGCSGYARFDFMINTEDDTQVHLIEVNTLPGIYLGSNFQMAAKEAGISPSELLLLILAGELKYSEIDTIGATNSREALV